MTQPELILNRLKQGWTTPMDALRDCGSMKLATRVGELRRMGHKIADQWVSLENGKRVKAYRLEQA